MSAPTDPATIDPDADLTAAELAFGLIDGADEDAALRRIDSDPGFRNAHDRWLSYALALFADTAETPPARVWQAIEQRLPANDTGLTGTVAGLEARVGRWRMAALAASVAAVAMTTVALVRIAPRPQPQPQMAQVAPAPAAPMVALLSGKTGAVGVTLDRAHGTLALASSDLALPKGRIAQLWVIPADGTPRSLGLLPTTAVGKTTPPHDGARYLDAGVTLAVSVEPVGGSPTGLPTGPVILTGKLATTG